MRVPPTTTTASWRMRTIVDAVRQNERRRPTLWLRVSLHFGSFEPPVTNSGTRGHLLVEVNDGRGWEALYRNAVPRVYPALLATLRDPELAEDALHEAFAEGLKRPPATSENLPGWLFRVALRRARRRRWGFISLREQEKRAAADEIGALLDRMEAGRLLAL